MICPTVRIVRLYVDSDGDARRVQPQGRQERGDIGALAQNAERAGKRTEPAGASPS